jgi:hypothetical protein
MDAKLILAILQMIAVAEPAVIQTIHDLLVGAGGKSDQVVLTSDLADWDAIIAKAREQLPPTA